MSHTDKIVELYKKLLSVPVEDIIGTVADLIREGKVRNIGVSEITAEQLRKANDIYPITALEIGYSLADPVK